MPCSSTEVLDDHDVSDSSVPIENATEEECTNKPPMVKPIYLAPRKCLLCIKKSKRIKYLQKKVRRFQIRLAKYKDNTTAGEIEVITFHNYPYKSSILNDCFHTLLFNCNLITFFLQKSTAHF